MATPNSPNDLTRQQLDELDTLLQRMLALPLNKPDVPAPPGRVELPLPEPPAPPRPPLPPVPRPEPVNWLPAPPEPPVPAPTARPTPAPFLGLTGGPDPEPATEYAPRTTDARTLADLLPFPIPDGPPPDLADDEELRSESPWPGRAPAGTTTGTLRGVDAPATPAGFRSAMPPAAPQPSGPSVAFLTPPPADAPPPPAGMPAARPGPVMTPPPPASTGGLLAPVSLVNRLIEGILDWCGPLGHWLTRPAVKQLLGVVGLGLLAGSAWWVARGMGWVG